VFDSAARNAVEEAKSRGFARGEVKRLRELIAAATPGEWSARLLSRNSWGIYQTADVNDHRQLMRTPSSIRGRANAAVVAAVVNALPALLDRIEVLEVALTAIVRQLSSFGLHGPQRDAATVLSIARAALAGKPEGGGR
jgi:hypothetical protein